MSAYVWGAVLTVLACAVAGAVVRVQRRYSSSEQRERYNEVNGFVFAIVGVLYAIVIAFVVVDVWGKLATAKDQTYAESTALVEMYWHTRYLPPGDGVAARTLIRDYTANVVHADFPRMREGVAPEATGWATLDQLRTILERVSATEGPVGAQAQGAIEELQKVYEARQARVSSVHQGVPGVMWFVLVGGAFLTIALTFLFGIPSTVAHGLLIVSLTAMVTMLLWTVYVLQQPYSAAVGLNPDAYQSAVLRFDQLG